MKSWNPLNKWGLSIDLFPITRKLLDNRSGQSNKGQADGVSAIKKFYQPGSLQLASLEYSYKS